MVAVDRIIIVIMLLEVLARAAENTMFIGCVNNLRKAADYMIVYTTLRRVRSQRITFIFLRELARYKAMRPQLFLL